MNRNETALKLLRFANDVLRRAGIPHSVLHGTENAPDQFGRDVDIMLDREREAEAIRILEARFVEVGIPFFRHYNPVGVHQFLFQFTDNEDEATGFEIDFLTRLHLRWGPILFTGGENRVRPTAFMETLSFNPWASFVKRILIKLLAGHWETLDEKRHDWQVEESDIETVRELLVEFFGASAAFEIISALNAGSLTRLQKLQPKLRNELYKRFVKTPLGWWIWATEEMAPLMKAKQGAPIVALVGPDGVGKSTVIGILEKLLLRRTCFPKIKGKHWRPGLLPALGRMKGIRAPTRGQAVPPREKPGAFGVFRQLYYSLDFFLGYWLVDRLESNKLSVLIYDRCLLDMVVHPLRFGFSSPSFVSRFAKFCQRPDIIILLVDEPMRIHQRKNELSIGEIERQFGEWEKLKDQGQIDIIVQVSGGAESTARLIADHITNNFQPCHRCYFSKSQEEGNV